MAEWWSYSWRVSSCKAPRRTWPCSRRSRACARSASATTTSRARSRTCPRSPRSGSSSILYQNRLAGEIPDGAFAALRGLQKLNLAGNAFSGPIPSSIASSAHLLAVDLSNNNFSGPIPEGLRKLGSNVQLQGELVRHGFHVLDMEFLFDACNGYVFSVSCLANFAIFL